MTVLLAAPADHGSAPPEPEELLLRAADGDPEAFAQLYDQTASHVLGLITQLARSDARAEEIMLDVFTTLWRRAPEYRRSEGSARAWIMAIALRRALADGRHTRGGVAAAS